MESNNLHYNKTEKSSKYMKKQGKEKHTSLNYTRSSVLPIIPSRALGLLNTAVLNHGLLLLAGAGSDGYVPTFFRGRVRYCWKESVYMLVIETNALFLEYILSRRGRVDGREGNCNCAVDVGEEHEVWILALISLLFRSSRLRKKRNNTMLQLYSFFSLFLFFFTKGMFCPKQVYNCLFQLPIPSLSQKKSPLFKQKRGEKKDFI
jgi:hypothetical protein